MVTKYELLFRHVRLSLTRTHLREKYINPTCAQKTFETAALASAQGACVL